MTFWHIASGSPGKARGCRQPQDGALTQLWLETLHVEAQGVKGGGATLIVLLVDGEMVAGGHPTGHFSNTSDLHPGGPKCCWSGTQQAPVPSSNTSSGPGEPAEETEQGHGLGSLLLSLLGQWFQVLASHRLLTSQKEICD